MPDFEVVGTSLEPLDDEGFRELARDGCREFAHDGIEPRRRSRPSPRA